MRSSPEAVSTLHDVTTETPCDVTTDKALSHPIVPRSKDSSPRCHYRDKSLTRPETS